MAPLFFSILTLSLLLLTTTATSVDPLIRQVTTADPTTTSDVDPHHHHFALFKQRFAKSYATQEEHDYRFKVFKANLRRAKRNQALDPGAVHGVTRFSDLTPAEFRKEFLGMRVKYPAHANKAPVLPTDGLPEEFDWRVHGAVTPVKDQGGCGSCWSFSTTGALEGAHFVATGELVSLSEQQLVDCDRECDPEGAPDDCDLGCAGGLMNNAFEYLLKSGGLMREEEYPYTSRDGTCKFDKSKIAARVANYSIVPANEEQIVANLVKYGPLPVGINARFMSSYIGGVSCPLVCTDTLNHGVLLVGYDSAGYASSRKKEEPYWIIKNSWGKYWGEDGYYKICRGYNLCGVNNLVSTVAAVTSE